jgi:hypothetical protein
MRGILNSLFVAAALAGLWVGIRLFPTGSEAVPLERLAAGSASVAMPREVSADRLSIQAMQATLSQRQKPVSTEAERVLEQARRNVEEAEAAFARVEVELISLDEQMTRDAGANGLNVEAFRIQADPLLDRLIAAEEAVQSAKEAERQAQFAVHSQ